MTMSVEQLRSEFETWWKDRQVAVSIKEDAFAAYQAGRAALQAQKPKGNDIMLSGVIRMPFEMAMADPISRMQFYQRAQQALNELEAMQSQAVIDDDHLSIVLDVYDNAMQKAFEGRELPNPCKHGTPEHKAWEKGSKEGKKKREAGLPNPIALQHSCKETSQDREDALVHAIQEAIALLGPEAPSCSGCEYEWNHALRALHEAIDHACSVEGEGNKC